MGYDLRIGTTSAGQIDTSTFKMSSIPDTPEEEEAKKSLTIKEGDTVNISAEGIRKSSEAQDKSAKEVAQDVVKEEETEKMIRDKIKQLEKELKELRNNPEQNKEAIKMKEQELEQYQGMLLQILNDKKGASSGGGGAGGGTPAKDIDSSLTETPAGMLCEVRF
ncbi:hypothetical protein [Maridesulfovibrio sp.]|uniref:hypothetical protein n=1 Tax=Maridesulfovibrio sp. TaxID=2795000 RepID=UPI0039EE818C